MLTALLARLPEAAFLSIAFFFTKSDALQYRCMNAAKIHLSAEELTLMQNSGWILTKNGIMEKVCVQFGRVSLLMQDEMNRHPPPADIRVWKGPKISRGEKYLGLPYVMLDYPRVFEKEHILAIRTFFWWGNFYSITLHVKGRFRTAVLQNLSSFSVAGSMPFHVATAGDEWNHNINSHEYSLLHNMPAGRQQNELSSPDFIKVAVKVDFGRWNEIETIMAGYFPVLLEIAGI